MKKLEMNDHTIIVVPSGLKNKIMKEFSNQGLISRKVMTLEEIRKKYEFDYDDRALFYLIKKYHYQYDVAKMYLTHLYEVGEEDYGSAKIKKIIEIKKELQQQGLLIDSFVFKEYLKGKTLFIFGFDSYDLLDQKLILELGKFCDLKYYKEDLVEYSHDCIYELGTIDEEVVFVANQICELIEQGIPVSKIKLCGVSGEYPAIIKRVFSWYHLPIVFQEDCLYATTIGQDFLEHLDMGLDVLEYLKGKYSLNQPEVFQIYNELVTILNQYVWADSFLEVRDFIVDDLKNVKVKVEHFLEEIMVLEELGQADIEDYVFLLGFNQGEVPRTYKDESYFNDELKEKLGLDTTMDLNQRTYQKWFKDIQHTRHLIITMKKSSSLGDHYLSSLNDDLKLELKKGEFGYRYSNLYNQLQLGEKLDTFIKYNEKDSDLDLLYSSYSEIPYGLYDSNYQKIDANKIREYLDHKLVLSYSAMNTYYQCGFRYYLSNILKLNIFEETFYTVLGNLFHYILSICFQRKIDLHQEYQDYISKCSYPFNHREKFFLNYLEKELEFIIEVINKQNESNSLSCLYSEEKIMVSKDREDMNVCFKGFVDKMYVNEEEDVVSIIDYKTGNPDLNLNHMIYGLDLQLPVYLYLARRKFPKAQIAGFYLQKILNNEISKDFKHSYEFLKEDKLKLQGYSNRDVQVLEKFDSSYCESHVIKGMRTTSKGLASKKILSSEEMEIMNSITENKIEEAIQNIMDANFLINPKRIGKDNLGCEYCQFKDICFRTEKNIVDLKEYKNMEFLGSDVDDTKEA